MSLVSLCLGFSVFGMLIIVNRHQADPNGLSGDSFVATAGGIGAMISGLASRILSKVQQPGRPWNARRYNRVYCCAFTV
jgi:hypothetical protein